MEVKFLDYCSARISEMSREAHVNSAIGGSESGSVNMDAHMGESVHVDSQHAESHMPALYGHAATSIRERSASCSPTRGMRRPTPNETYSRGRSPTRRSKQLGPQISKLTKKLTRDIHAATSQTHENLTRAAITAQTGQSIAQEALKESVQRKQKIQQLHASMHTAMQEHAAASASSTTQRMSALAEELTNRVGAVIDASHASLMSKQNEELTVMRVRFKLCGSLEKYLKDQLSTMNCLHYMPKWRKLNQNHNRTRNSQRRD